MILIDLEHEKKLKKDFPYLKISKNKVTFQMPYNQQLVIPSDLYPLINKKRIQLFTQYNTEMIDKEDIKVIQAFNETEFEIGRCYTNTEKLKDNMLNYGISEKDIKTYTGWIVIGHIPIHHSWLVYKNIHVLDGGVKVSDYEFLKYCNDNNITDKEKIRKMMLEIHLEEEKKRNSETRIFGPVIPIYYYIGTPSEPSDGIKLFNDLINRYPNHPSYQVDGMNAHGASKTQQMILDRKNEQ